MMKLLIPTSKITLLFFIGIVFFMGGCSSNDVTYQRPVTRPLPEIPEIKRSQPVRPHYQAPVATVKPYAPKIQKYGEQTTGIKDSVITQQDVQAANRENVIETVKDKDRVDVDPYAAIPDSRHPNAQTGEQEATGQSVKTTTAQSSPAVKTLLIRAQADLAIGRSSAAIDKLERGLRIESDNPKLWHALAQAHYDQSDYQQAISMSKKSIRYAGNDELIAKNWSLIKKAGLKSGDTTVVKEALDYFKVNP